MESEGRSQHVAGEVRALLARRQITGKQLAVHLGVSQFSVSRRLRGQTAFSIDELTSVAGFLGVPVEELITGPAARETATA